MCTTLQVSSSLFFLVRSIERKDFFYSRFSKGAFCRSKLLFHHFPVHYYDFISKTGCQSLGKKILQPGERGENIVSWSAHPKIMKVK